MHVQAIKTEKVYAGKKSLREILDAALANVPERSIIAISSKIVALCEGRVVPVDGNDKEELIARECEYFLPTDTNRYGFHITITGNTFVAAAGIDESNADGNYVLWPLDPQRSANDARAYLVERFKLKEVGVIITDSTSIPLRFGTVGAAIAFSGFKPLHSYIGTQDLFGRELRVERASVVTSLAVTASYVMGEGNEQTPITLFTDIPSIDFIPHDPTPEDINAIKVDMDDDVYYALLKNAPWQKGGRAK
jgi:F420-0:gamma-glutamyl ligase